MQKAKRRRTTWAVAASLAAHLAVLVMALLQRPNAPLPIGEATAAPEVVIQVLLTPRPRRPEPVRPAPPPSLIRLHRPPTARLAPNAPTARIAPAAPPTAPPGRGPVALHPAPLPQGPNGDLRTALRQSPVGCANELAVGLNRAERDHCNEVFGKGAKTAPILGLGLAADKQRLLEASGARREADYRYKHGPTPAPLPNTAPPGNTAEQMSRDLSNDRPVAKIPY